MSWASGQVITAVSSFLMEQGYGCDVTVVPLDTNPALTSIAENGEPDIATEIWASNTPAYDDLAASGAITTLTNVLSNGGVEGWYIPAYMAEAHPELTSLDGVLANAELLGNRFHNCPSGWTCREINAGIAASAGLELAGYEIFSHGSGETLAASIAAAYEDRAPWIGYYWTPTAVLGKYPMVKVDLGAHDNTVHKCNADPYCLDKGISDYPIGTVVTIATTDFAEREPEIAALMSNLSFTNTRMSELLAWQEENGASADEVAAHYLTTYPEEWSGWLNEHARENLAALVQ